MKRLSLIIGVICTLLSSCGYPKFYFMSSEGWATYDRTQRRFEIMWDSKMQANDTIITQQIVP